MTASNLAEIDSLEILVIVDNETDIISRSPNTAVQASGPPITNVADPSRYGEATKQMKMDSICCGAHGLSLMITATKGSSKHTLLFDTGPEEEIFAKNAKRLQQDLGSISHIHLSHWHRDHSGGLLEAVRLINTAKAPNSHPVTVDVHPERPDLRGIDAGGLTVTLEADPSFEEIEQAGALLTKAAETHTALADTFLVSGEIPRVTEYEKGMPGGIRFTQSDGKWSPDALITDERFVMVNLKGKGLVIFTGCSHAGVINTCLNATKMYPDVPLYAVVGGYHLADANEDRLQATIKDFQDLSPKVLMPGHCTGWRFKSAWDRVSPGGMVPLFSGRRFTL